MFLLLSQSLKQQYSKKTAIGDFCLPHGSKIKLKVGNFLTTTKIDTGGQLTKKSRETVCLIKSMFYPINYCHNIMYVYRVHVLK
jgi:hypothetical protein